MMLKGAHPDWAVEEGLLSVVAWRRCTVYDDVMPLGSNSGKCSADDWLVTS